MCPALVEAGGARVLFGTTSWADRSLVSSGSLYPRRSMTARARLAYYAPRFPLAEVATTYRFPPTPDVAAQWVERTPPGFTFDVRAWSLFTGAPTLPDSLWPDLQDQVRDRARDLRRLYPTHLTPAALEECWARFEHALRPLHTAGKLGAVILQYPGWFTPRPEAWAELAAVTRASPTTGWLSSCAARSGSRGMRARAPWNGWKPGTWRSSASTDRPAVCGRLLWWPPPPRTWRW